MTRTGAIFVALAMFALGSGCRRQSPDSSAVSPRPVPPQTTAPDVGPGPSPESEECGACGLAIAPDDTLYIADACHHQILRLAPGGALSVVAGDGWTDKQGGGRFSGDGGQAIRASLSTPCDIATDAHGNLYIADSGNNRVRKVDRAGIITTIAGNGRDACAGDGGSATSASVIVHDVAAAPDGTVYISDRCCVRRVDTSGIITTVARNGCGDHGRDNGAVPAPRIEVAAGIAVDARGRLYIADRERHQILRLAPGGALTVVAGDGWDWGDRPPKGRFRGDGGSARKASLSQPADVAVSPDGSIYIADGLNRRVRKVDSRGIISTIAGTGPSGWGAEGVKSSGDNGPATQATLADPAAVAADRRGNVYILDDGRIRQVDRKGIIRTVFGE